MKVQAIKVIMISFLFTACNGEQIMETDCSVDPDSSYCNPPEFNGTPELPALLTPGQEYIIPGSIYDDGSKVIIDGTELSAYPGPNDEVAVMIPASLRHGSVSMVLQQGINRIEFSNAIALLDTSYPTFIGEASAICSDQQFYNASGVLTTGTKSCGPPAACTAGGQSGCVATEAYLSVDTSTLAAKVVSGATVAGIAGQISDCSSDGETSCLSNSSYPALDKAALSEWDIKSGKTAGGITGSVKTACRNAANLSLYNYDGNTDSIPQTDVVDAGSPVVDWWDTVDNFNANLNTLPTAQPAGWTSDNLCGKELWEDITADGICDSAGDDCMMRDNVSGLTWSEGYPDSGNASTNAAVTWDVAIDLCNDLDFGGITEWRLPTQMELQQASMHGIRQLGSAGGTLVDNKENNYHFIASVDQWFWSASSVTNVADHAWRGDIHNGLSLNRSKSSSGRVLCVSP